MKLPATERKPATRAQIREWIHAEADKIEQTVGQRIRSYSILPGAGPESCNWMWNGETVQGRMGGDSTSRIVLRGIVSRAQVRLELAANFHD